MVYIRNNRLHLTEGKHVFNTRHEEPLVVERNAVLVLGGIAGPIEIEAGGLLVLKGMLGMPVLLRPGGRIFVAEGAWAVLPGRAQSWPVVDGAFVDPVLNGISSTTTTDASPLYEWDGISLATAPLGLRVVNY